MANSVIILAFAALVLGASAFPRRAHPKKVTREYDEAIELMQPPPALPDQGMAVSDEVNLADGQMDPVDSPMNPADSPMNPADSPMNSADSPMDPADSPMDPADSQMNPADSPMNPADSPMNPADSKMDPADSQMNPADSQMDPADSQMDPGKKNSAIELDQSLPEALKKAFDEIKKLVEAAFAGSLGDREAIGKLAKVVEANTARIDRIEKEIVRIESVVTEGFKGLGLARKVKPIPKPLNLLDLLKELIGQVGDTKARRIVRDAIKRSGI